MCSDEHLNCESFIYVEYNNWKVLKHLFENIAPPKNHYTSCKFKIQNVIWVFFSSPQQSLVAQFWEVNGLVYWFHLHVCIAFIWVLVHTRCACTCVCMKMQEVDIRRLSSSHPCTHWVRVFKLTSELSNIWIASLFKDILSLPSEYCNYRQIKVSSWKLCDFSGLTFSPHS